MGIGNFFNPMYVNSIDAKTYEPENKKFEIYSRHDGVLSKYTNSDLDIEDAAELIEHKPCDGRLNNSEIMERLNNLKIGEHFCYYRGDYLEQFVKRTK